MISKEKKASDYGRVWQNTKRYRITGSTDRNLNSKNPGAHRASEREPEGSSSRRGLLKMVGQRRGMLLTFRKRFWKLSCTDRKIRHQKIITGQLSEQSGISALFWIGGRVYPRPLMCTKGDFYSSHAHFKIIRKTPFLGFFVALLLFLLMKQLSLYRSVVSGLLPQ